MLYIVAIAIVLSASVTAVPATPQWGDRKCLPKQYEAVALGKVAKDFKGQGIVFDVVGNYAVDFDLARDVFMESLYYEGNFVRKSTYLRTMDSDYLIDVENRQCTKLPATGLEQMCSDSPSLHHVTSMVVGDEMTDTYVSMIGGSRHTSTFLRSSFTLISEVIEQTILGVPQMFVFQTGNRTMGVKDPNVFELPSYC